MADSLDDGEFWLPPQFLTDDDLFSDNKTVCGASGGKDVVFGSEATTEFPKDIFPLEFPYGFDTYSGVSSVLSSPVDSVVGSTEESDEDELLTCRFGRSQVGGDVVFGKESIKGRTVSGSPQSTLCGVGGCNCRKISSHGSPNECSKLTSPPETWVLLQAAAGEVARIRMDEERRRHTRGILGVPQNSTPDLAFTRQPSIAYQKIQAAQFYQMRQQQIMKQSTTEVWGAQAKASAATAVYQQQHQIQPVVQARERNIVRPIGLSPSVWPPLQQAQHRQGGCSGMRTVFLGNRGAKRECAGTGVFLPRQIATPVIPRKKSACSTVLVPEKVVQALKLDDGVLKPQLHQRISGTFHPGGEKGPRPPRNCNVQKRNHKPQPETELRLPQEWTY